MEISERTPALYIDGNRVRKSPYWEATERYGCLSYDVYNHMYIPGHYFDPVEEYWQIVNHVALWDVSVERCLEIDGRDGFAFASCLTPRELGRCAVGQGRYVVITADDGGIVNDPVLLRLGENHFWLALADSDALLWARGVAAGSGLDVRIREAEAWPVQVQGPKSRDVLRSLFGPRIDGIKYYWCLETELDGIPVVISRTGWTAELGYEVYLRDASRGVELWERILAAGKPHQIRPTGPCDLRRMEAGIFNYGSDMTLENNPLEVSGLERMVEEKEADYYGKAALARIRAEGVRRKLVGIELEGEPLGTELAERWAVEHAGREVGRVTNAVFSPRLRRNIGYAWVPIELAANGTRLPIARPQGMLAAKVVPMPFLDAKKEIPRA
jgi:aminomethyltransferase